MIGLIYSDKDNHSIYPMSPVEILFLNMVTSTPPAMSLGIEPALGDIMSEPPRAKTKGFGAGIFSPDIVIDILVYGAVMGALSLGSFAFVLAQAGGNIKDLLSLPLGSPKDTSDSHDKGCNTNERCDAVFRARGTAYLLLSLAILLHAYNCRSTYDSIIVGPAGGFRNIYSNPYLFFSVFTGILLSIVVIYIPGYEPCLTRF